MKLCRFETPQGSVRAGLSLDEQTVLDLSIYGVRDLESILEMEDPLRHLEGLSEYTGQAYRMSDVRLLAPVEHQEVWAAGVTYRRSQEARTRESAHDASAYDRVYEAPRPELFFKSLGEKVVGPGEPVGVRQDSRWTVPEPELALVLNSRRRLVAVTLGNDVSARDLEGENLLYLPQAKVYQRSCALGPYLVVGWGENVLRQGKLTVAVRRHDAVVFEGEVGVSQLRRSFEELIEALFRSQVFPRGVVLLTGTGIVPPDDFALQPGDRVRIAMAGLGVLENPVVNV